MKKLKFICIFIISISLFSCSDDESSQPLSDSPSISFDVNTIIGLAANTDITNLVTVGGQPAATYTSDLEINGRLIINRPESLLQTDELFYNSITITNEESVEVGFNTGANISDDGNLSLIIPDGEAANYYNNSLGVPIYIIEAIDASDTVDIEYKYLLEVTINRGGTAFGPYFIDPKVRIKSRN